MRIQKFFITDDDAQGQPLPDDTVGDSVFPGYNGLDTTAFGGPAANVAFQTPFDSLMFPNADGEFMVNLTNPDTTTERDDPDVGVRFTITPFDGSDDIDENLLNAIGDVTVDAEANRADGVGRSVVGYAVFSDDDATIMGVSGESTTEYRIVRASSTANSLTVTVTDPYGDGFRNAGITVSSSLDEAAPADDRARYPEEVDVTVQDGEDGNDDGTPGDDAVGTFNTRRNGTYRIGYNYADDEAVVEVVSPSVAEIPAVPDDPDTDGNEAMDAIPAVEGTDVMVFWAKTGTTIESDHDGDNTAELLDVLVADVASRAIVVDESDPRATATLMVSSKGTSSIRWCTTTTRRTPSWSEALAPRLRCGTKLFRRAILLRSSGRATSLTDPGTGRSGSSPSLQRRLIDRSL